MLGKLREIAFFADMANEELSQIAEITTERNYRQGALIIEEMTEAERFFIIHKGKIEISKRFEGNEAFVLSVQSDGDFFGEMALLDEGRRSATVRALEQTSVLEISRPDFETLLYKAPVLAYRILKELSVRLRETGALLISQLKHRNRQLLQAYVATMAIVAGAIKPKNDSTSPVYSLVAAIGERMGIACDDLLVIELCALIHDLGMATSSALPELEGIVPQMLNMLKMQESFDDGSLDITISVGTLPRAKRLIALADEYFSPPVGGYRSIDAVFEAFRAKVPECYDSDAVEALVHVATSENYNFGKLKAKM